MSPRLLLFSTILLLTCATAAWADEPIREIEGVQPKAAVFDLGGAEKPLVIESADVAVKHFDAENLATLKKEVDFSKQTVLLFAWRGSGQDRIEYVVLESFPEQVRFSYQRGRTKDLRQHVKVFVLRSNVKYGFNGKPASQSKNEKEQIELEVKQDGKWKPAQLPLAGLAEGKAVEVRVRGTLRHGIMAIGGETTGTIIRFGKTTWELNLRKKPTFGPDAEKLSGKRVVVTGTVRTQAGIEISKRTILTVESIGPATERKAEPTTTAPKEAPEAKADAKSLFEAADLVVAAKATVGVMESMPVQFAWTLKVEKTLKGQVPPDGIRGRHGWKTKGYVKGKMPPWLKTAQATSCFFFLKQNAKIGEDPLGVIPWTTELEKSLLSRIKTKE